MQHITFEEKTENKDKKKLMQFKLFSVQSVIQVPVCIDWAKSSTCIDPIHKWRLFHFFSAIVQISLPSLTLEQEFFAI